MTQDTVLILDDDSAIRDTMKETLELDGYQVFAASNGQEGLDMLRSIPSPSLILLDLMMPVMNGWEFLKAMSENYTLAGIPVVIITAFSDKANVSDKKILRKPFDFESLTATVNQYCPGHKTKTAGTF